MRRSEVHGGNTRALMRRRAYMRFAPDHLLAVSLCRWPQMRKRLATTRATAQAQSEGWLDLEHAAAVEVTSEDEKFPVESSLSIEPGQGWRAAEPGTQTIRLLFDQPQDISRISLVFEEEELMRTQEFILRSSSNPGAPFREIVRQQWNFSAPTSTRETEEYRVELPHVNALELTILPDISGGPARASLKSLRLC